MGSKTTYHRSSTYSKKWCLNQREALLRRVRAAAPQQWGLRSDRWDVSVVRLAGKLAWISPVPVVRNARVSP
uniref:Uncharacterized protein n=1 Tax=Raphanus sativus TaxID=3726 RepID=A0A650GP97_RAPSA|nr:hypothetical protein [Raphanus sativus]